MRISSHAGRAVVVAMGVLAFTVGTADAKKSKPPKSKPDAALICASSKHKEAGKYCSAVLKAWSQFEKSGKAILLTIDSKTKNLQVTSVDED